MIVREKMARKEEMERLKSQSKEDMSKGKRTSKKAIADETIIENWNQ